MAAVSFPLESLQDTEALGGALAMEVQRGDIIFLKGELGAGKTSVARGFLRQFFSNPDLDVPSPSYLLHFTYRDEGCDPDASATEGSGVKRDFRAGRFASLPGVAVHHLDPYRLPEGRIAGLVEFEEVFAKDISLIEWPERLGSQLVSDVSPARLELTLGGEGPQAMGRVAQLKAVGARWTTIIERWKAAGSFPSPPSIGVQSQASGGETLTPLNPPGAPTTAIEMSAAAVRTPPVDPAEWRVLGIESSCDDTGAAVLTGSGQVLGEALASQEEVHEEWGGVVPKLAQQAHQRAIDGTVDQALKRAGMEGDTGGLTAIAVTVGPGLGPCLQVGVKKAYELAAAHRLPIIRVHHMEAHASALCLPPLPLRLTAANTMRAHVCMRVAIFVRIAIITVVTRLPAQGVQGDTTCEPGFPYATVLVSGGHNMVLLTSGIGVHRILGSTLDDSIGEAFDKTARLLGITNVPGGPHLERLASGGNDKAYPLPLPLSNAKDLAVRNVRLFLLPTEQVSESIGLVDAWVLTYAFCCRALTSPMQGSKQLFGSLFTAICRPLSTKHSSSEKGSGDLSSAHSNRSHTWQKQNRLPRSRLPCSHQIHPE